MTLVRRPHSDEGVDLRQLGEIRILQRQGGLTERYFKFSSGANRRTVSDNLFPSVMSSPFGFAQDKLAIYY